MSTILIQRLEHLNFSNLSFVTSWSPAWQFTFHTVESSNGPLVANFKLQTIPVGSLLSLEIQFSQWRRWMFDHSLKNCNIFWMNLMVNLNFISNRQAYMRVSKRVLIQIVGLEERFGAQIDKLTVSICYQMAVKFGQIALASPLA